MGSHPGRGAVGASRIAHWRAARPRTAALLLALALIPALGVAAPAPETARAAVLVDYPSWDDVQDAKADEAAAKAEITRIKALLADLEDEVAATQKVAEEKGTIYAEAQTAYDEQAYIAQQLQEQADAAQEEADDAKRTAAQLIANLSRGAAGTDLTATLFAQSDEADALLYNLSAQQKFSSTNQQLYTRAVQLQNNAQSLTDQAAVAQELLDELRAIAEAAFEEAQDAAIAAQEAYDAQAENKARLEAQLEVLTTKREVTEADYRAGVEARAAASGGVVNAQGWANPTSGYISSHFGMRYHPIYHVWKLHSGTDIAGGGYNAPIYAAADGRVVYAGYYSDLGYYIKIDHGGGIVTGYAHINTGGMLVSVGEIVIAGQQIAKVGSTGGSTGPHLHFMVYQSGVLTNPVTFMQDRGVTLG